MVTSQRALSSPAIKPVEALYAIGVPLCVLPNRNRKPPDRVGLASPRPLTVYTGINFSVTSTVRAILSCSLIAEGSGFSIGVTKSDLVVMFIIKYRGDRGLVIHVACRTNEHEAVLSALSSNSNPHPRRAHYLQSQLPHHARRFVATWLLRLLLRA